jgi:hypothetical protein
MDGMLRSRLAIMMMKNQMFHIIDLAQGRLRFGLAIMMIKKQMIHKIDYTQGRHAEIQVGDHDDEEANDHKLILPMDGMLRSRFAIMMMKKQTITN